MKLSHLPLSYLILLTSIAACKSDTEERMYEFKIEDLCTHDTLSASIYYMNAPKTGDLVTLSRIMDVPNGYYEEYMGRPYRLILELTDTEQ